MKTDTITRLPGFLLAMALTLVLVGCGGGEGSELPYSTTPAVIDSPIATTPPITTDPPSGGTSTLITTSINWNPPTTRINNEPLPLSELAGYRVYYGTSPSQYSNIVEISDPLTTKFSVSLNTGKTYYFVVRAFDSDGFEGPASNTVTRAL